MVVGEHVEMVRRGAKAVALWRLANPHVPLDLSRADLAGAELDGLDLSGADLTAADLRGARIRGAQLRGVRLECADLRGADLGAAILLDVAGARANLDSADLASARMTRANLCGASMRGTSLRSAHLERCNLIDADLTGADLEGADVAGGRLNGACIVGANLASANLCEAQLERADLTRARMTATRCGGAVLDATRLDAGVLALLRAASRPVQYLHLVVEEPGCAGRWMRLQAPRSGNGYLLGPGPDADLQVNVSALDGLGLRVEPISNHVFLRLDPGKEPPPELQVLAWYPRPNGLSTRIDGAAFPLGHLTLHCAWCAVGDEPRRVESGFVLP